MSKLEVKIYIINLIFYFPIFLIGLCLYLLDTFYNKDYVPEHNGAASKLSWEMEQQLGYTTKPDIAR